MQHWMGAVLGMVRASVVVRARANNCRWVEGWGEGRSQIRVRVRVGLRVRVMGGGQSYD